MDFIINLTSVIVAAILLLYYVTTKKFAYWKKQNVPFKKPIPLFGNYAEYILMRKSQAVVSKKLCDKFLHEPYFGSFYGTEPALVIQDPEIIKLVLIKDFYFFSSRDVMDNREKELVARSFFFNYGDDWKLIRQKVAPIFTLAKLKVSFKLIEKRCHEFEGMLDYETSLTDVLEVRKIMIRYSLDTICTFAFGVEAGTLGTKGSLFTQIANEVFSNSYYRAFTNTARSIWPNIFYALGLQSFPPVVYQFFKNLLMDVFKSRNYEPSAKNDLVDLLLTLRNQKCVGDGLTNPATGESKRVELLFDDNMLVSQCIAIFAGGFETAASSLSITIYELAKNLPAQRRAQQEIDDYLLKNNNELNHDCLSELRYLDACVSETLRLYPSIPIITREAVHDHTFPSGLRLEKGTRVHVPVFHLHRRADLFPDPEQYKPERFMPDAGHTINPYTYFPFGEGPRTCVGMRFGKVQVLSGLVTFLKKFSVELAEGTPEKLDFMTTTFLLQPASNLALKVRGFNMIPFAL